MKYSWIKRGNLMEYHCYRNPFSENSEKLAKEFDAAAISNDTELIMEIIEKALNVVKEETTASKSLIFYSIGTAYGDLQGITASVDDKFIGKQLYYFRKSIKLIEDDELDKPEYLPYILAQKTALYTNYANVLDSCGRKIAAIEQLKKALLLRENFDMALGNLGRIYHHYGMLDYDEGHQDLFHYFACQTLHRAISGNDPNTHSRAKEYFKAILGKYPEQYVDDVLKDDIKFKDYSSSDLSEFAYREWCLQNALFLNTTNDLPITESAFATDALQLPDMITSIYDKPIFHGMFAQLKQEYIYARYLYYETINQENDVCFADKDTNVMAYTDYTQYSIRIEKLKTSFKTLYGMFDKIAFFIEHYFDIGIKEIDINFKTIWKESAGRGKNQYSFKNVLKPQDNIALSALYWISKDFFERFEDPPNPELKRITDIRNALEHKYVKVTWGLVDVLQEWEDGLALYVSENELYDITFELLKILREAIIYISLCVNIEEMPKREDAKGKLILPMSLMNFEDEWKI